MMLLVKESHLEKLLTTMEVMPGTATGELTRDDAGDVPYLFKSIE
jgi:hypothetical protein